VSALGCLASLEIALRVNGCRGKPMVYCVDDHVRVCVRCRCGAVDRRAMTCEGHQTVLRPAYVPQLHVGAHAVPLCRTELTLACICSECCCRCIS
jgi:hypothetical protein